MRQAKIKLKRKPKNSRQILKRRFCRLCKERVSYIDYKDIKRLERFVTDRGKIVSRRSSGNCAGHQRMIARAIKRARFVALLPYTR